MNLSPLPTYDVVVFETDNRRIVTLPGAQLTRQEALRCRNTLLPRLDDAHDLLVVAVGTYQVGDFLPPTEKGTGV